MHQVISQIVRIHTPDLPLVTWKQVGRPGPKKKARMSRTRSDFLTRCNSEGATQSDDDDEYYIPAHSRTLPPSLSPPRSHPEADRHSDSEMVKTRSSEVTCPPNMFSVHLATSSTLVHFAGPSSF